MDIAEWLTGRIASALAVEPDRIDRDRPLAEYGLDSMYALNLCGEIEECLGLAVEPTLAWDYPTVTAMASHLRSELARREEVAS
jgi:acyl carrier protein